MTAEHIPCGEPAHEAERQAIRFIVQSLPDGYRVYSNAWLVERSGAAYELDTVVVAPHAIYIVEIKSFRGTIEGNDHDWFIPEPCRSPLRLSHKTAQVLTSTLQRRSFGAGQTWVEGFVYLSHASKILVEGAASATRLHGRERIITALTDAHALYTRIPPSRQVPVDDHTRAVLHEVLKGADPARRPKRRVREYVIQSTLERTDRYVEHLVQHDVTGKRWVLRVYHHEPLADEAERDRTLERWRWEAQVLARIGDHPAILKAAQPFESEEGLCIPFEHFQGISLPSWVERFRKKSRGQGSVTAGVAMWRRVAAAIRYAHKQGVIHRLLRPEVVLVQSTDDAPAVRVTGFDLAKRPATGQTIFLSTVHDDRLRLAAPEVIQSFSSADARSDQFGLGAILGFVLAGRMLFDSTPDLVRRGGLISRLRDINPYVPASLDEAVSRMLAYRVEERFPTLDEAVDAVESAVAASARRSGAKRDGAPEVERLDPDAIPPGTRLGTDYEVLGTLGAGGLATVYAARHLVSGRTRALKVARAEDGAEEVLRQEFAVLEGLDHPNVVKAKDPTYVVPDRLTLVLERVEGVPLSSWLETEAAPDAATLRSYAEDLLGALAHLEDRHVVHKDLKPDNLIVGKDGLTLLDFSLAGRPPEELLIGTPLYRDPALVRWDHGADRYAAALCLFELYTGRHAFDGHAPGPGEAPEIDEDEFDAPGLADFFRKALDPSPAQRHPSAVALRAAFREALGLPAEAQQESGPGPDLDPSTPLRATSLGEMAVKALRRAGVFTQGDLVALDAERIGRLRGVGTKRRRDILEFRQTLLDRGMEPARLAGREAPSLMATLVGDPSPIGRLGLTTRLADALARAGYGTVGELAAAKAEALRATKGVGQRLLPEVLGALERFADHRARVKPAACLEDLLERVLAPLSMRQRQVVEKSFAYGPGAGRPTQGAIAEELGTDQPTVSLELHRGLECLDLASLSDLLELLDVVLEGAGGLERLDQVLVHLTERWPCTSEGTAVVVVRLADEVAKTRLHLVEGLDGLAERTLGTVLARPYLAAEAIQGFVEEATRLAGHWPPLPQERVRRALRGALPEYELDPIALAERLCDAVHVLPNGGLVVPPIAPEQALPYLLGNARLPLGLDALREEAASAFGEALVWPEGEVLAAILATLPHCRLEGGRVLPIEGGSVRPAPAEADALPPALLAAERRPEAIVGDLLRGASRTASFRLLVAPPDRHVEIGRSVARALGPETELLSLESLLLERMEREGFDAYEEAELYGDTALLRQTVKAIVEDLLRDKGLPGKTLVLADTAILEVCDGLDLVRRVYDETVTGGRGFWAVVIPGVILKTQPLFNEKTSVFQLRDVVLPLLEEIPDGGALPHA